MRERSRTERHTDRGELETKKRWGRTSKHRGRETMEKMNVCV